MQNTTHLQRGLYSCAAGGRAGGKKKRVSRRVPPSPIQFSCVPHTPAFYIVPQPPSLSLFFLLLLLLLLLFVCLCGVRCTSFQALDIHTPCPTRSKWSDASRWPQRRELYDFCGDFHPNLATLEKRRYVSVLGTRFARPSFCRRKKASAVILGETSFCV